MAQTGPLTLDPGGPLVETLGEPEYSRRLSDKILTAFNHAYAAGDGAIAEQLHALLVVIEEKSRRQFPERRGCSALDHAALWKGFVEARNQYRERCSCAEPDPTAVGRALAAMKAAYKRWSGA